MTSQSGAGRPAPVRRTIGVFDSGIGGLTVLQALRRRLPDDDFLYLGDTARLPYGTKSSETVRRYALRCCELLVRRRVDALVVACNTASALALDGLAARWPDLPLMGVVEPGAEAAVRVSRGGDIGVIGTESTVRGEAYQQAIQRRAPAARVRGRACSVFVALAEEGWFDTPATESVARAYLDDWFDGSGPVPDTLVLGCTHFPVLAPLLARLAGPGVVLVDSAGTTAEALAAELGAPRPGEGAAGSGSVRLLATDGPERFAAVGSRFLDLPLAAADVEIVDL